MSKVQVDKVVNLSDDGAPQLTYGAELPVGYGLTGAGGLNITGVVTAASAVFSGNVTIGGTLTYEDVTNVDVVGVSTFAGRMNVSSSALFNEGLSVTAGVTTIAGTSTFAKATTVNATLTASEGINVSAGVGTFAGNVSIADKIIHTGDTNTALRFPSADTISLETGGTERARVTSDGEFLVGTTTDNGFKFKVSDGGASEFAFAPNDSGVNSLVNYDRVGAAYTNFKITALQQTFFTGTSPSERARIDSSGNLQFNTTTNGQAVILKSTGNHYNKLQFDSGNTSAGGELAYVDFSWDGDKVADILAVAGSDTTNKDDGHLTFRTSPSQGNIAERLRITSDGQTYINTTAVTNTHDFLTVKRPASGFGEMSMTVDANTSTSSAANAFVFTKSKDTYWNGYGFQSSHGHIGAIVGKRDSGGGTDQEIRVEIGGTHINQSETKTWRFLKDGNFSLSGGNVVVASGNGIDFSATGDGTGSGQAEILDDYEEGSWTPVWSDASSGGTAATTNQPHARYTKIGRVVHLHLYTWSIQSQGTSNAMFLQGLPFTSVGSMSFIGSVGGRYFNQGDDNQYNLQVRVNASNSYGNLEWAESHNGDGVAATFGGIINAYTNFTMTLTYLTGS